MYVTESGVDIGHCLVHGQIDQASSQTEMRENQQHLLQSLVKQEQRLKHGTVC